MKSSPPSPQEAARELLRRRRGRASLVGYANAIDIPGKPVDDDPEAWLFKPVETGVAAHHKLLLEAVERAMTVRRGRLMVCMPPGSAKSSYCSVVAPTWYMGRTPSSRVILASYGSDLAKRHGRRARQIAGSPEFAALFGAGISTTTSAADEWALSNGAEYLAGGILSGITGNRAHGLLIDDPVKGRAEAESPGISERTWEAYNDDLLTRLLPGGWIILVTTRWAKNDLAGRLLPQDYDGRSGTIRCTDGVDWEMLNIPAQCERDDDPLGRAKGEYLWPEWFDEAHWAPFQSRPRTWASLFQQRPAPGEGDLFKPDMLETVDAIPAGNIDWVRGWDLASTEDKTADATAGVKLGRLPDGRYIIGDLVHVHEGPHKRDASIKNTAAADGRMVRIGLPQDPGQAGKTQVFYLTSSLPGYRVISSPESGDKVTRAEPFAAQVNVGNVLMLRAPWNDAVREQLRYFPTGGVHDDIIDALSRAFAELIGRAPMVISDDAFATAMSA
jgi:predicted phage terminase large subunit-like protein